MSLLLKDPAAVLDYTLDWGRLYLEGDFLAASSWTVEPNEDGGIAVLAASFDDRTSRVKLRAGISGQLYRVSNRVVTAAGREDARSLAVRVETR